MNAKQSFLLVGIVEIAVGGAVLFVRGGINIVVILGIFIISFGSAALVAGLITKPDAGSK